MRQVSRLTLATLITVLSVACSTNDLRSVDPEHEAAVLEAGGQAADSLVANLMSHLSAAMSEGGLAYAVEFCSVNALDLTAGVADAEGMDIKRTSLDYRNPANAPDQHEIIALRHFESARAETGKLPDAWVQRVGLDEYRYYRPLTIGPPCLPCHGSPEDIDPAVAQVLAERYPDDLATGYAVGDFRGVIRVSVPSGRIEVEN